MRIAVLADTHLPAGIPDLDALGPEVASALRGVDLVLHAGDVVAPSVLDWCEQFAPVRCALGGQDHFEDPRAARLQHLDIEGWALGMTHDIEAIPASITSVHALTTEVYRADRLDLLIAGDSHYERLEFREGALLLDPGSPVFPHHQHTRLGSLALLEVTDRRLRAEIVVLGDTPGAPNPCTPATIELTRTAEGTTHLVSMTVDGAPIDARSAATPIGWRPPKAPPLPV